MSDLLRNNESLSTQFPWGSISASSAALSRTPIEVRQPINITDLDGLSTGLPHVEVVLLSRSEGAEAGRYGTTIPTTMEVNGVRASYAGPTARDLRVAVATSGIDNFGGSKAYTDKTWVETLDTTRHQTSRGLTELLRQERARRTTLRTTIAGLLGAVAGASAALWLRSTDVSYQRVTAPTVDRITDGAAMIAAGFFAGAITRSFYKHGLERRFDREYREKKDRASQLSIYIWQTLDSMFRVKR